MFACIISAALKMVKNTLKLPHYIYKTTLAQPLKGKYELMIETLSVLIINEIIYIS